MYCFTRRASIQVNTQHDGNHYTPNKHAESNWEAFWLWPVMAITANVRPDHICQIQLLAWTCIPKNIHLTADPIFMLCENDAVEYKYVFHIVTTSYSTKVIICHNYARFERCVHMGTVMHSNFVEAFFPPEWTTEYDHWVWCTVAIYKVCMSWVYIYMLL